MFRPAILLGSLLLLCWLPAAMADAPQTQPSLDPTNTFRSFLLDIQQGNAADIANCCVARGKEAQSLLKDFQAVASSMAYLRKTAAQKFGANAADSVLPALPSLGEMDDVIEKITGDRAELTGTSIWPVQLIKTQGQWKLDLDWLAQSQDMPANPHWFAAMAQAIHRTADDIATGRLASAPEAAEAMQARQQGIPDSAPTTGPSTQP